MAIGVWIGTGSRNEHEANNGVSHFLEHMFFKGTKTKSAREIAESFDSIGGQVNAFTSKEYTCYYAKVLDDHSKFALDTLADMFLRNKTERLTNTALPALGGALGKASVARYGMQRSEME